MSRRKLLIAESADEYRKALAEFLENDYEIRTCQEGHDALEMLHTFDPHILLLDLMLPGLDGISLLYQAEAAGLHPVVLATTRYTNDYVIQSMQRLGVGYIMVKPCDVKATAERLADLNGNLQLSEGAKPSPSGVVSNLLLRLSMPTKLLGYTYLQMGILELAKAPSLMITKELYPAIAAKCGTKAGRVERCIRNALDTAWAKRDEQVWRMYFPPLPDGTLKKPSNGELLTRLAAWMRTNSDFDNQ